jgi:hypothetical protein
MPRLKIACRFPLANSAGQSKKALDWLDEPPTRFFRGTTRALKPGLDWADTNHQPLEL